MFQSLLCHGNLPGDLGAVTHSQHNLLWRVVVRVKEDSYFGSPMERKAVYKWHINKWEKRSSFAAPEAESNRLGRGVFLIRKLAHVQTWVNLPCPSQQSALIRIFYYQSPQLFAVWESGHRWFGPGTVQLFCGTCRLQLSPTSFWASYRRPWNSLLSHPRTAVLHLPQQVHPGQNKAGISRFCPTFPYSVTTQAEKEKLLESLKVISYFILTSLVVFLLIIEYNYSRCITEQCKRK